MLGRELELSETTRTSFGSFLASSICTLRGVFLELVTSTLAGRDFGVFGVCGLDISALLDLLSLLGLDRVGVRTREVDGSSRSLSFRLDALVISDTSLSKDWVDTANSSLARSSF